MKEFYGSSSHDSKVGDYDKYKEKQFKSFKEKLNTQIDNISASSLSPSDKVLLLDELKDTIDSRILKRIN